jgi:preprotein translocase SecF subunit
MAILKPIHFVPENTKIPFVSFFKVFFSLSIVFAILTVILLFTLGLNLGIDFLGGIKIEVRSKIEREKLRTSLDSLGLKDVKFVSIEKPDTARLTLKKKEGFSLKAALLQINKGLEGYRVSKSQLDDKQLTVDVSAGGAIQPSHLRRSLESIGLKDTQFKLLEKPGDIGIRLPRQAGDEAAQQAVFDKIEKKIQGFAEVRKKEITSDQLKAVIHSTVPIDLAKLRTLVGAMNLGETQIYEFGEPAEALIRIARQPGGDKAQQEAALRIREKLSSIYDERGSNIVGPTISGERMWDALIALLLTCLGIFTYIWFRFEWQFATGAIVALTHDILLTIGVFSALQLDFDGKIIAALLTILGYSINDTVVIYDRIRENLRKFKKMPLDDLLNLSINETLSRTVMTVVTTLLALLAIFFFGGEVIRDFAFAMIFGVLIGTYSSVFIAAPLLRIVGVKRDWSGLPSTKPVARNG